MLLYKETKPTLKLVWLLWAKLKHKLHLPDQIKIVNPKNLIHYVGQSK